MKPLRIFVLLGCLAAPPLAHAASFACDRARSPMEHLVCANPALGKADEDLAAVYKARLADFPVPDMVRDSQRAWLAQVSACLPKAADCLASYRDRIATLTTWSGAKVYTSYGKSFDREGITLVLTERDDRPWLDWYGAWMPDAYRPKPFPDGFLASDGAALLRAGAGYTLQDHDDAKITLSEAKISFGGDGMSLTARQGPIAGDFLRVR